MEQDAPRRRAACLSCCGLQVLWLFAFSGMIGVAALTGQPPSARWMVLFGCLELALGTGVIFFRRELPSLSFRPLYPPDSIYTSRYYGVVVGVGWVLIGLATLVLGLLRR